jgi:hypothetical protein
MMKMVVQNNLSAQLRWADKFQNERRRLDITSGLKAIIGKLGTISEKDKRQVNTAITKYQDMAMSASVSRMQ